MTFVQEAQDAGLGISFGREGPWTCKNVSTTNIAKGELVAFDLTGADAETTASGYEELGSCFYNILPGSVASSTLSQYGYYAIALEDITSGAEGRVLTAGRVDAICRESGGAILAGERLQAAASSSYLEEVGDTVKHLGIALESMSTTGPETIEILFNGISGLR